MVEAKQLDPYKTVIVCRVAGREVGRKSAASANANEWLQEMTRLYGCEGEQMVVDYEEDENAGLLAALGL